jgi:hypothetical protein
MMIAYAIEPDEKVGCGFCMAEPEWGWSYSRMNPWTHASYGRGQAALAQIGPNGERDANFACLGHLARFRRVEVYDPVTGQQMDLAAYAALATDAPGWWSDPDMADLATIPER